MYSTPAPAQLAHFVQRNLPVHFVFFGSSSFSVCVLEELEKAGVLPIAVVTMPDKPKGRNLVMTPTEVNLWAKERDIDVLTPEVLQDESFIEKLKQYDANVFIVASYGKIIPEHIIELPKNKTLNVHPSLLPKYRGSSPVESMILNNEEHPGVSIMQLDKEMDHGPIVASLEVKPLEWPVINDAAITFFGHEGGKLLASILSDWNAGTITPAPQDHAQATYTKKISKEDGLLDLTEDPLKNYLKILAYHSWPKAYFFDDFNGRKIRVIVTEAVFDNEQRVLTFIKVIPEGKKEMAYTDYLKGKRSA